MKIVALTGLMFAALALTACSTTEKKDPYAGWNAQKIYATGHNYLRGNDYNDAIDAFVSLNSQYPFEKYAKKGDLELIYAYYTAGDPALALAASSRYIRLYPNDKNAAYAYYMAGVVEFNNGRGFLQRYFPYDMSEHNSENYGNAFNSFDKVINQFPTSPYTQDARRRMIYLKNMLGNYQLNIAEYYFGKGAYVAAISRAQDVLVKYPRTTAVKPALQLLIKSYQKINLSGLEASAIKLYSFNYGSDSFLKKFKSKKA